MSIELIVTPILSGIAGFLPLYFVRPKHKRIKLVKYATMCVIVALAATTIYFGIQKEYEANQKESKAATEISNLHKENETLLVGIHDLQEANKKIGKGLDETPEKTAKILKALLQFGYTEPSASKATSEQISQSEQANTKLDSIQQSNNNNERINRSKTTVVYFPKDIDPNIIQSTLRNIGFNSEIGKAKNSDSTNAIWFGSNVNIEDVKIVAYTLIRAGVKIKTIRPFSESSPNRRTSLIQVGADRNYINKSDLSVDEIRNATEFSRN
jgi:hypothetical protein